MPIVAGEKAAFHKLECTSPQLTLQDRPTYERKQACLALHSETVDSR